jgi:heterotetrameric sarcosine oxidase gamma subunit
VPDQPLARSAIAATSPIGVRDGWQVSALRSSAQLRLADHSPLSKVRLRANPAEPVAARLGVPAGRAHRIEHGTLVVGSGPGEWLLIGAPGRSSALLRLCEPAAPDEFATTLDLTHGLALLRLTGEQAEATLSKICALDLSARTAPNGTAVRTSVARVITDIVRDDVTGIASYLLHCERSLGQHLYDTVLDAGAEFGIEPDGFRYPPQ